MSEEEIYKTIVSTLSQAIGDREGKSVFLSPETNFHSDLLITSLEYANILIMLQDDCGVSFDFDDLESIATISDLTRYIYARQVK